MRLQIDDNRAELAPTSEREIVDANLRHLPDWRGWKRHDTSKNGLARGLYPQAIRDTNPKPSTSGKTNDLRDLIQTPRDTCKGVNKWRQTL